MLAIISVRETDANRLVDKEDVGPRIPRVRMELRAVAIQNSARTQLHK